MPELRDTPTPLSPLSGRTPAAGDPPDIPPSVGAAGAHTTTGQGTNVRVLKWTVPADDRWHPIGRGPVALVDVQGQQTVGVAGVVTVWVIQTDPEDIRAARVYGTGQPVPSDIDHVGSCQDGPLVWHVFATHFESEATS